MFYLRPDVSRPLPHKRYATKAGPAYVMNITLRGAWRQFLTEYPTLKVGYTKLCGLRPKNVRKLGSVPVESCLCIYCLNIKYKLDALNRLLHQRQLEPLPDETKVLDLICCHKMSSALHKPECIFGQCEQCKDSIRNIKDRVLPVSKESINWTRWGRGLNSNRFDVISKCGTVSDLLQCLLKDIDKMSNGSTFRPHIFTAHWQYRACKELKFTLREHEVLMIMDFAENRKACYNAEVKSAHFGKQQITLHPVVMYFKNAQGQLVRHSLMYLSDDICHDFHAVNYFTTHTTEYVKKQILPRRVTIFSDGCASHYKGKGTFADLSLMQDVSVERCYYGSEHGKGEADDETGVLSQMLTRAVQGGRQYLSSQ